MPLSDTIESIKEMTTEMAEDARQHRVDLRVRALRYAKIANATECLELINVLIERVSSITGEAGDLEDAACVLIRHIENEGE